MTYELLDEARDQLFVMMYLIIVLVGLIFLLASLW